MNITPTTLTISQLLGSPNEQYVIPAYQRRYSWRLHHVRDLWDDIEVLGDSDVHLLGTIVCLSGYHRAGINRLEVVDGQQRLATISILLHCLLERLKIEGEDDEARDLDRLLRAKPLRGRAEPKILLDSLDANQFHADTTGKELETVENPQLAEAFGNTRQWIAKCNKAEAMAILYKLQNQSVIVRLDVSDAKDAFKLFETINNRGLPLSPTDIIKNFVLGNAARFGESKLAEARKRWAELIKYLDGISTDTFFRQFMISVLKRRVTRFQVVEKFQFAFMKEVEEAESLPDHGWYCDVHSNGDESEEERLFETGEPGKPDEEEENDSDDPLPKITFNQFLKRLVMSSKYYREIVLAQTGKAKIDRRLRNLRLIKSMPSYGFLMTLRVGGCKDKDFENVLQLTEAFLLRRHVCRERTNENEDVFARLCAVNTKNPIQDVRKAYREYSPSNARFKEEFASVQFSSSVIDRARYCLEQFEMYQHGDYPELLPGGADEVHVEHIIPQRIKTKKAKKQFGDWPSYLGALGEERHPRFVSRIGNLALFAGELNIGASNNPYESKKAAYKKSAFKLTRRPRQKWLFMRRADRVRGRCWAEPGVNSARRSVPEV
jgi:hypothetical protein